MEAKKNPRIDLENKRSLFIQIGLLVALSVVLFAFELKQYDKEMQVFTSNMASTDLEETMIQTERQQDLPPPPPQQITTMLEIVDNNTDILEEIEINIEANDQTVLQDFVPAGKELQVEEEVIYQVVEEQASFKGGDEARMKFLRENLTYPPTARDAGIEGIVYVQFVVEKDGSVTKVEIRQSNLGGGCEEAAIEAVKKMPKWNPGKQRNRPVRSIFILPIQFQLAK